MAARPLDTPEFVARLRKAAAEHRGVIAISEAMGIDRTSTRKYLIRHAIPFVPAPGGRPKPSSPQHGQSPAPVPEPEPEPDPVDVERQRADTRRNRDQVRSLARRIGEEQSFRDYLTELVREVAPRVEPPEPYRPPAPSAGTTSETLLLHLSDWHGYEQVDPERVLELNRYDDPTMRRRIRNVVATTINLKTRLERADWRFRKLVIAANGDFVSGTIHEVERHSDAENVMLAVFGVGRLLGMAVRDLAAHFDEVEVYCTSGNHGRLPDARRMQQKDPLRSWDTAVYLYALTATEAIPNVRWTVPNSYSVLYEVEGHTFYQGHGHDIKAWNSIPFYGINRMASNLNALMATTGNPIDAFLFGHFHNASSMDARRSEYFINGSLIGGTEFSLNGLGQCDKPKQYLMGIHRTKGVTHRWPLLADEGVAGSDEVAYPRPSFAGREVGARA